MDKFVAFLVSFLRGKLTPGGDGLGDDLFYDIDNMPSDEAEAIGNEVVGQDIEDMAQKLLDDPRIREVLLEGFKDFVEVSQIILDENYGE